MALAPGISVVAGFEPARGSVKGAPGTGRGILDPVTPAEEKCLKLAREKVAKYPGLAREALRRREYDKAEEYWRLWHEAIDELLRHFGAAPGSAGRSNGVTH